jgi:hypothetical protein
MIPRILNYFGNFDRTGISRRIDTMFQGHALVRMGAKRGNVRRDDGDEG